MIGQNKIKSWLETIKDMPHFIVLIGESGSGKRTVCKYIANKLSMVYSECEIRTEAVREVIDTAYKSTTKVMYCFPDADTMKAQAKNAMLKITEEPPENAYFCLTLCDDRTLLDTIKSRANVFYMESYSEKELTEYFWQGGIKRDETDLGLFLNIAETPKDIDMLLEYGKEFYYFVELVVANIAEVEPANAFKSAKKLALKTDEGYDLTLFWKAFSTICYNIWREKDGDVKYLKAMQTTDYYNSRSRSLGVNKQQLYDMWVFDIRSDLL